MRWRASTTTSRTPRRSARGTASRPSSSRGSGKLNPLAAIASGFFYAGILVGGDAIQVSLGLPAATVQVFNGVLLVFLIGGDFFLHNRVRLLRSVS